MGRGAKAAGIFIVIVILILVIILPIYFTKIQCKNGFGYKCDSPPAESPSTATAPQTMSPTAGPSVATAPQTMSPTAGSGLGAPISMTPLSSATLSQVLAPTPAPTPAQVTTFTSSTTPSQVVAALQAASPNGLISLGNIQYGTTAQADAVTTAYLEQCQIGEYQKTPCNAPCDGTGFAVRARGRIGGGTTGCPVETTWNINCTGPPCVAPPPAPPCNSGGRANGLPCCEGLQYDDGYCF